MLWVGSEQNSLGHLAGVHPPLAGGLHLEGASVQNQCFTGFASPGPLLLSLALFSAKIVRLWVRRRLGERPMPRNFGGVLGPSTKGHGLAVVQGSRIHALHRI